MSGIPGITDPGYSSFSSRLSRCCHLLRGTGTPIKSQRNFIRIISSALAEFGLKVSRGTGTSRGKLRHQA